MGDEAVGAETPALGDRFQRLADVMSRLRSPNGCPWDLEQTPDTLSRHLLEEAYETVEAIDCADWGHLCEELGDLMLQIVFQARIAEENGRFDLGDVVEGITGKLLRRHPHIFGSEKAETPEQVVVKWERIKREEGKHAGELPAGLPALLTALKLQNRAAREGFDWESVDGAMSKLAEESRELEAALEGSPEQVERELGDLIFSAVNVARHLGVDPEGALRRTCREFSRRYAAIEAEAERRGVDPVAISLEDKESLWQRAKNDYHSGEER